MPDRHYTAVMLDEVRIQEITHSPDDRPAQRLFQPAAPGLVKVPDHRTVLVVLLGAEQLEPFNHGAGEAALLESRGGVS